MQKKYATALHPSIQEIVEGHCIFPAHADAVAKLNALKNHFVASVQLASEDPHGVIIWIKGFEVSGQDEANGFVGNFADLRVQTTEDGRWAVTATRVETSAPHPQKKRAAYPHPNWGHPIIRQALRGNRYFGTKAEAQAELAALKNEFPKSSMLTDDRLFIMVFEKQADGKKGTVKIALYVDELVDGRFRLLLRDNTRPPSQVEKPPIDNEGFALLRNRVEAFLGAPLSKAGEASASQSAPEVAATKDNSFLRRLSRLMGYSAASSSAAPASDVSSEPVAVETTELDRACLSLLVEYFVALLATGYERREGAVLYHFTQGPGLRGICGQEGLLRLNKVSGMNDPSDVLFGAQTVSRALTERFAESPETLANMEYILGSFSNFQRVSQDIYFGSFTEDVDILELWRVYADFGRGYAVAFDRMKLATYGEPRALLAKVAYHPQRQAQILSMYADVVSRVLERIRADGADLDSTPLVRDALLRASWCLATMLKHNAYRNEREWRLVQLAFSPEEQASLAIDPASDAIRSYARGVAISRGVIGEIVIGSAHEDFHEDEILRLMQPSQLQGIPVRRSEVPLRRNR